MPDRSTTVLLAMLLAMSPRLLAVEIAGHPRRPPAQVSRAGYPRRRLPAQVDLARQYSGHCSTVNEQVGAGDEGGGIREQERRGRGNVIG